MTNNDYALLVEWCASINMKFNELERNLIKWKSKLATLTLQSDNNKTWIHLSLKDIKEETNDVIRLMGLIQTSLADKDPRSDYYKYGIDELKYFTYNWEFILRPEVEKIYNQHEKFIIQDKSQSSAEAFTDNTNALRQLGETLQENEKLMRFINAHIYETRDSVINIKELSDQSLHHIQQGRINIAGAKLAQRASNGATATSIKIIDFSDLD
ncbi:uncharacterized protein LOC112539669 [Tetranychus urticae]|nr:uncharacterized protein LOC112539669 [Tetranychus urticae]